MHVTSLTGRLAVAAGALGVTALASGLTGAGAAMAGVTATGAGDPVAASARVAGAARAGAAGAAAAGAAGAAGAAAGAAGAAAAGAAGAAAAGAAGAAIARAAIAASPAGAAATGPARAQRPTGIRPPIPAKLTLGQWPGLAGTRAAAKYFGYPYPHPAACTNGGACVADKWAFYRGQCTSWVAYRLNQVGAVAFSNSYGAMGRWGDAVRWGPKAKKLGITVNTTPTVGAIAWYSATKAAPDGHVAYVERVNSAKSFVMSEMNYDADNGFWVHTITQATGDWPTEFIHFASRSPQ